MNEPQIVRYTPTTEVIRHALAYPRERLGEPRPIKTETFDRWLNQYEAELRNQIAAEIEARQFDIESTHHFGFGENGWTCLCGFVSPVSRQRTEHITNELNAARIARGAQPEETP